MPDAAAMNSDVRVAQMYHEQTKHSYRSVRVPGHGLDWANRPLPYKIYEALDPVPIPRAGPLAMSAADAVALDGAGTPGIPLTLHALAQILYFSNGVTRVLRRAGGAHAFRAASCTGALYHIDLYVVSRDLEDLSAGIYCYGPYDHALRQLRAGDMRAEIAFATAAELHGVRAPAVIICADTFWRNAWKYRSRAYRHSGWDTGVILANLLATAAALGLPAQVVDGFADDVVNHLVGADGVREAAVSLVALGRDPQEIRPDRAASLPPLDLPTRPLSGTEVAYPLIRDIHIASSLRPSEVSAWRRGPQVRTAPPPTAPLVPLATERRPPGDSLSTVIRRRGSSRFFTQEPITLHDLSVLLQRSTRGIPADFLEPYGMLLTEVYVIVHAVEGLRAGTYVYHRTAQGLEQLRDGVFRGEAGYLALEQALAHDAAVNIYYLAELDPILERFGNRGYRAAQLEAGILGGKVYLLAYALGLGATGLTFYDDEVIRFFSPHATGKSVLFLMAVGRPRRRLGRPA